MYCRRESGVKQFRRGFTLIELIVAIAIIATLTAVVAPAVFRHVSDAKSAAAQSQIDIFALALSQYRMDLHSYPTTEQGLAALRSLPQAIAADPSLRHAWRGPYLTRLIPVDPWGRAYRYESPGRINPDSYDLYSLGRDGAPGGEGEDADITSWGGTLDDAPPSIPAMSHSRRRPTSY